MCHIFRAYLVNWTPAYPPHVSLGQVRNAAARRPCATSDPGKKLAGLMWPGQLRPRIPQLPVLSPRLCSLHLRRTQSVNVFMWMALTRRCLPCPALPCPLLICQRLCRVSMRPCALLSAALCHLSYLNCVSVMGQLRGSEKRLIKYVNCTCRGSHWTSRRPPSHSGLDPACDCRGQC